MKIPNNLSLIMVALCLSFCISTAAQTENIKIKSDKWQILYNSPQVKVSYKYDECSLPEWGTHEESAYLQFKNLSNKKIIFKWSPTLWYGDKCYNCNGTDAEMTYDITLEPGQVIEGTCSTESPRYLKIFGRYLNVAQDGVKRELKNFEFKNIHIATIQ